jgi:hypothetical protein
MNNGGNIGNPVERRNYDFMAVFSENGFEKSEGQNIGGASRVNKNTIFNA